jgi:hypothetical protein
MRGLRSQVHVINHNQVGHCHKCLIFRGLCGLPGYTLEREGLTTFAASPLESVLNHESEI